MTDEDQMFVRDLAAIFAMQGMISYGDHFPESIPERAYKMADMMMEAREGKKAGLPPIKRKGK
jgi:hypothetical protein